MRRRHQTSDILKGILAPVRENSEPTLIYFLYHPLISTWKDIGESLLFVQRVINIAVINRFQLDFFFHTVKNSMLRFRGKLGVYYFEDIKVKTKLKSLF